MRFIPTYQEAVEICRRNPVFYETKHMVRGYVVSTFNYRIATFEDFRNGNAFEMRGLTFVFNTDGTVYKRFLGLEKFFNINETEITQYSTIKDYEVIDVSDKLDGTCISFIELPNGEIIPKTKANFDCDQTKMATILADDTVLGFIRDQFSKNHCVFFEYTSPMNRIVIKYPVSSLSLIKIRDGGTGEYLFDESVPEGLKTAENETSSFTTLKDMLDRYETLEDKEGSVIVFKKPDGEQFLVKVKTADYFAKHHLLTEFIYQENLIIEMTLNETIDDVLSQVDDEDAKARIMGIVKLTQKKFIEEVEKAEKVLDIYRSHIIMSQKDFYFTYKDVPGFYDAHWVIKRMRRGDEDPGTVEEEVKKRLLKETYHLMDARNWLGYENFS